MGLRILTEKDRVELEEKIEEVRENSGASIESIVSLFSRSNTPSKYASEWSEALPATSAYWCYIWNKDIVTLTDGSTLETKPRIIGVHGATGAQGDKGDKGDTGAPGADGAKGEKGEKGDAGADGYSPVRGTDYWTEDDKAEIVAMVIKSLGSNPVFGYVDENNNIIVSGNLADGSYAVKYEMEDGSTVDIGDLVLDNNVYYSVTNTLTNCTNSNGATQAVEGESYAATISANSGYELSSVVVTMGGTDVSTSVVSGGKITIANVTGNIVIMAVATESAVEPSYTNLAKNFTSGRFNSSGDIVAQDGATVCTDYIPAKVGDVIRIKGFGALTDYRTIQYTTGNAVLNVGIANALTDKYATYTYDSSNGIVALTITHNGSMSIRFSGILTGTTADVIITRNEEIV